MTEELCWYSSSFTTECTFNSIWRKGLTAQTYAKLTSEQKNILAKATLGYMLNIYRFTDMVQLLRRFIPVPEIRELRRNVLVADFRTVLALKLVIIRALAKQIKGERPQVGREIKLANQSIMDNTFKFTPKLLLSDKALFYNLANMELLQPLLIMLQNSPIDSIPSVRHVIDNCAQLINSLQGFIARFAYRKHRFIMTSQQMQPHDIIAELIFKATGTYYYCVPFKTELHITNIIKRAIHNHGMFLIKYWNQKENSRLLFDPKTEQWTNLIQTYGSSDDSNIKQTIVSISRDIGLDNLMRQERAISLQEYLRKADPLVITVIQLLATEENIQFTKYVQQLTRNPTFINNENIYQNIGRNKYIRCVAKFVQIPNSQMQQIIQDMRELFS